MLFGRRRSRCRGRRRRRRGGRGRSGDAGGGGRGRRGCRRGLRLGAGIDPAGMDVAVEGVGNLGIDLPAKTGQATKRRLNVAAGAAETVVQIEMPERGVEIVEPHQADHAAAEPDAFRIAGGAVDDLRGLDEFIGLALVVLGGIGGCGRRRFAGLVLGVNVAALGERATDTEQKGKPGSGEMGQNRILKLNHPSTHRFPDLLPARSRPDALV
jgi:hypothetical protein